MGDLRFFHEVDGDVHELPSNPYLYERRLQEFFERHLRALTDIDFLASEYSTGQLHGRRIDTLGIDAAGQPVVVEYKRHQDENVINQGLDYLAWLEDHRADFRELVRQKLGDDRAALVDFRTPRLLCVAGEFLRQDQVAAQYSRRRVELLRYRRYGDAHIALEWVYGNEEMARDSTSRVSRVVRPAKDEVTHAPQPPGPSVHTIGGDPDYSVYKHWDKANESIRALFFKLKTFVESLGSVETTAFENEMSFKCMVTPGKKPPVVAYVHFRVRRGDLRVLIWEKLLGNIQLEKDDFTRPSDDGQMREITIRDDEHLQRAEPLLRAAYENLLARGSSKSARAGSGGRR